MKRGFIAACAVAAALSAAATGCTRSGSTEQERAADGQEPAYTEQLRISDATEALTKRCMNRAGFRYWTSLRLSLEESRPLDYVNDDVAWAAAHGYGSRIQEKTDKAHRANPNGTYREGLSPQRREAYDQALDGGRDATVLTAEIPTPDGTAHISKRLGGCSAEAEKKLYGDPAAWFRAAKAVSNLTALYAPRVTRDKEFTAALAAWSRCMGLAGHPYPDPPAAQDAVARQAAGLAPDKAFEGEKRVAVAEARCAHESSLADVTRERERHYRAALPGRYRELIDTYRRLERQAYARASEVTGPRV